MPLSERRFLPSFKLPAITSGNGNVMKFGRGLHVYYDLQPANVWAEHVHTNSQIVLALDPIDAEMSWRTPDSKNEISCVVPHVWFVPGCTPHSMKWKGGPAAMVVFYLEHEFIKQECDEEPQDCAVLRLSPLIQQDYMLCRFCDHFRELCHGRCPMSEPMIFAGAAVLASTILRACQQKLQARERGQNGLPEDRLELVFNYIDAHIGEPLTLTTLGKIVGLSKDHFGRMFRCSTNISPMNYIWRCRLQRARQMLEAGDKVTGVAAALGFCDQSHLDRKFRQEFHCSPGSVAPGRTR